MKITALLSGGTLVALALCCRAEEQLPLLKTGEHYQIRARASTTGAAGGGRLALEIGITDGWKLNRKAPLLLKLSPGDGLEMKKTSWSGKEAAHLDDAHCRFEIPYTASQAATVGMDFNFVICNDTLCQKKKFSLDYRLGEKKSDTPPPP